MSSKLNAGLEYLKETKELIREALISQGVDISDSDPFRSYAEKVASISGGTSTTTFSYGASQYFSIEPDSSCWTKADGTFISNAKYYDWLEKIQSGALSVEGVSVKLHTETYSEYDFVINSTDKTFKLPLLNGEESIISNRYIDLEYSNNDGYTYYHDPAPANGWYYVGKKSTASGQWIALTNCSNDLTSGLNTSAANQVPKIFIQVSRGDILATSTNLGGATAFFRFIYAKGNGSLYYYTGATENTLSEDIEELKSQVGDISAIVDYINGEVV